MRFRQLEYFVAVAEELHFRRAAERLHMSQPPLSQQIRSLEEELGVRLFDRTRKTVRLTREGQYFLAEARTILGRAETARKTLQAMGRGEEGIFRMGYVEALPTEVLYRVAGRFQDQHPLISLTTQDMSTIQQIERVLEGSQEMGVITANGRELPAGLGSEVILVEDYVLAMPADHPLAREDTVALSRLKSERFIRCSRESNPEYWAEFQQSLMDAGCTDAEYRTCCELPMKHSLVSQGAGLAILPAHCVAAPLPGVVYKPLVDHLPRLRVAAIWDRERKTPIVETFLQLLREGIREVTPDRVPGNCPIPRMLYGQTESQQQ